MIGYKSTTSRVSVVFFFESPAPNPLQTTFFCPLSVCFYFFALAFLALVESNRAPSPAPVPCVCHLSIHYISRFFSSPMQAVRPPPLAESSLRTRFGRSGRLFFLVCCLAHLHDCIRLSVLHALPPSPMFPNASLFFCYPAPNGPSFKVCWWIQTLFLGDPTPLSSPSYPSLTFPPP
jgi:hypothetical protein